MRLCFLFVSFLLIILGCSSDEEQCAYVPETSSIKLNVSIEALQDSITSFDSKQELVNFFTRRPQLRDYFFNRPAYPNDSVFINELYSRFQNPGIDTLLMETKRVFGDLSALSTELESAFINMKYYYPEFTPPNVQTVITGLESDLFVSDTLVIIGLDYFLGEGAKYRPNMYEYMLRRYDQHFIVPSILLLYGIDTKYNKTSLEDRTVLADMISYGKAYYFAKHMLPCVADSIFIGYTTEEIEGSKANEDLIWKRLVEDEVLYSTSHLIKQKYIAERPKTLEVGEKCPGRIATWVGWEMVKKFSKENPTMSLPQIMETPNARSIFEGSRYRPI